MCAINQGVLIIFLCTGYKKYKTFCMMLQSNIAHYLSMVPFARNFLGYRWTRIKKNIFFIYKIPMRSLRHCFWQNIKIQFRSLIFAITIRKFCRISFKFIDKNEILRYLTHHVLHCWVQQIFLPDGHQGNKVNYSF